MPKRKLKNLMHVGELAFHGLTWNLNKNFRSQTFGENNGKMKGGLVICGDLQWKNERGVSNMWWFIMEIESISPIIHHLFFYFWSFYI
jgi:hypothetical protein